MISVDDNSEFTILTVDFIETLAKANEFILKIWVNGSEIPYRYTEKDELYFMQEGIRIKGDGFIDWIFYDTISAMRLYYDKIE